MDRWMDGSMDRPVGGGLVPRVEREGIDVKAPLRLGHVQRQKEDRTKRLCDTQ